MKVLLIQLAIIICSVVSLSYLDNSRAKNVSDNKLQNTFIDSIHTGWIVSTEGGVAHTVRDKVEKGFVSPTWRQSVYFSLMSWHRVFQLIGIIFFVMAALIIVRLCRDEDIFKSVTLNIVATFFCLILFLVSYFGQPMSVSRNNYKEISRSDFELIIKKDGNLNNYWKKTFDDNLLTWAGHN
jgi:hypothetical protein